MFNILIRAMYDLQRKKIIPLCFVLVIIHSILSEAAITGAFKVYLWLAVFKEM